MRSRGLRHTRTWSPGCAQSDQRPPALISASRGAGWYGRDRGDDRLTEGKPAGEDFLAAVCEAWEREAVARTRRRSACASPRIRTGIVLDKGRRRAGEDASAVQARRRRPGSRRAPVPAVDPPRRPGRACTSRALDHGDWYGAVQRASAPEPVTNHDLQPRALGRALHRPASGSPSPDSRSACSTARWPISLVFPGQRAVPARPRSSSASDSPMRSSTRRCRRSR